MRPLVFATALEIAGTTLEKFSIAPVHNFTDNLSAFVEYSTGEVDTGAGAQDNDSFSIETVFTFYILLAKVFTAKKPQHIAAAFFCLESFAIRQEK